MQFEWDEDKSEETRAERGFGFDYAALVFDGPTLESVDDRFEYGETRVKAIGEVDGHVLTVIYTDPLPEVRRIISARLASRKERKLWQSSERP